MTNTLAPYAAQVIGKEFGHGEDKNTAAQLVSHAILGATLAYINGGDPTAGGSAAVASEAAAIYLTNQYKNDPRYQDKNGEFQPNLLPESVKTQIRDLTAGIGAVIGGAAGDSSYSAQLAGVIGQNAVENNVDSYKDIQNAKAYSEKMYKDTCAAYGLGEPACGNRIKKEGLEILQGTAMIFVPTSVYEIIPIGKGVGIVVKGSKKLIAVYKDAKAAEKAVEKAGAKVENNIYRDDDLWSNKPSGKQEYSPALLQKINQKDLEYLKANNIKFSEKDLISTIRAPDGKVVFLEKGTEKAGLLHVLKEHQKDFENIGVKVDEIPKVLMNAIKNGKIVGYQGKGTGRPIYETVINGERKGIAITIGNNGFIVGANPTRLMK